MKTLDVYRAEPININDSATQPEPVRIVIAATLPDFGYLPDGWDGWAEQAEKCFQVQAEQLEKALHDTLPGGTYDRLFAIMLQRKASLYRVSRAALGQSR